MLKRLLCATILAALFSSCVRFVDKSKSEHPADPDQQIQVSESLPQSPDAPKDPDPQLQSEDLLTAELPIDAQVVAGQQVGSYTIDGYWPKGSVTAKMKCESEEFGPWIKSKSNSNSNSNDRFSFPAPEGKICELYFSDRQIWFAHPEKYKIPMDLLIHGRVHFRDIADKLKGKRLARVKFEEGSRLITEGQNVVLYADRIDFSDSEIFTFEDSVNRSGTKNGRSGGRIELHANLVTGSLHVVLMGEDGMNGHAGAEQTLRPQPNTRSGVIGRPVKGMAPLCSPYAPTCVESYICNNNKSLRGERGQNGFPGNPGGNGGHGGAAGEFEITYQTQTNFELSWVKKPGKRGMGGAGSAGGLGGEGGPAADDRHLSADEKKVIEAACQSWGKGETGSPGPKGQDGQQGIDGQDGRICRKSAREFQCY